MRYKLLAIEGNIGSGKTSLATKLAQSNNGKLVLEQFADNPFLPKFYSDQAKYAFPLELFFMAERYQQLKTEIGSMDVFNPFVVSDYMFTKSLIFAKVTLSDDEFRLYSRLFQIINPNLPVPGLIVYINASITQLMGNIQKRGRPYELSIPADYLQNIQDTYMDYFRQYTHLRVLLLNVSKGDFYENPDKINHVFQMLDQDFPAGITRVDI